MLNLNWRLQVCTKDNSSYQCCRTMYCFHIKGREVCRTWKKKKKGLDTGRVGMGPELWPTNRSTENRVENIGPSKGCFLRAIIYLICVSWLPSISCCFSQSHCPFNSLCSWKTVIKLPVTFTLFSLLLLVYSEFWSLSLYPLFLLPEDGCNNFLPNIGKNIADYNASRPKRQYLHPVVHLFKTDNIQKYHKPRAIYIPSSCYVYLPSASSRSGEKLSTGSSDPVWKNKACLSSSPADNFSSPCRMTYASENTIVTVSVHLILL